jgi:hypothetical protein
MNIAWDRAWKLALVLAGGLVVFYFFNPLNFHYGPRCALNSLTGMYCPGCGSTRALHQLAHGHLGAAFRLNPLAISLLPFLGYYICRRDRSAVRPVWIWALVVTVVGFGLLRNLPFWPFTLLAP